MDPQRLEGLVLREALCEHCGYQFGGATVRDGRVRCSECGKLTDVAAPLRRVNEPRGAGRSLWRAGVRMGLLLIGVAVVVGLVAWRIR